MSKVLDGLHSKVVRMLERNRCFTCGSTSVPTCGHLIGRTHKRLRWDIRPDGNCHVQCWKCNSHHSDKGQGVYVETFKLRFGEDRYYELLRERKTLPLPDKEALVKQFRAMLKEGM